MRRRDVCHLRVKRGSRFPSTSAQGKERRLQRRGSQRLLRERRSAAETMAHGSEAEARVTETKSERRSLVCQHGTALHPRHESCCLSSSRPVVLATRDVLRRQSKRKRKRLFALVVLFSSLQSAPSPHPPSLLTLSLSICADRLSLSREIHVSLFLQSEGCKCVRDSRRLSLCPSTSLGLLSLS